MPILIILITALVVLLTFYFLTGLRSRSAGTRRQGDRGAEPGTGHVQDGPQHTVPFLLFSSIKVEKTFRIQKGTVISTNYYILEGQAEVIREGVRIGVLRERQITHGGLDMLGLEFGVIRRAITEMVLAELPVAPGQEAIKRCIALKMVEKTCFEPALRLCCLHTQVARLETHRTTNFEEFVLRTFGVSNHKIDTFSAEGEVDLEGSLYYVVSGSLIVNGVAFDKGSIFGYFGVFFNYYKGFTCTASESTILKQVPYSRLRGRCDVNVRLFGILPAPMVVLASTAEWRRVPYGTRIFTKEMKCDAVYLIDGVEYGCKECVLGLRFEEEQAAEKTVDVIRIPKLAIDMLMKTVPRFYEELTRRMFERSRPAPKVVLITPTAQPCDVFIERLRKTLGGSAAFLRNTQISEILGRHVFDRTGELVISEHLNGLRERSSVVVVCLENEYSRMLKMIYPYCDIIFLVGTEIVPNSFERKNVEFVKLYERRTVFKRASKMRSAFLCGLLWGNAESDGEEDVKINPLERDVGGEPRYRRVHHILSPKEVNFCNKDYERFARYLTGERYGLVLGGGGARGFAHVGVIQALEEENIPIDVVGGTSMGALVGALYARELDYVEVYTQAKRLSRLGASLFYLLMDMTFPFVSLFSGRTLNQGLRAIFRDQLIQNFWLEYYCVTTNLITLDQAVHFNGSALKYLRSSMSVVGLVPPVFYKGEILCDGAYVNNLPTDVMASMGVKNVIAVKVAREFENKMCRYDSLSGFILLLKSLLLSKSYLTIADMQYRLSFLTDNKRTEGTDFLILPELGAYKASDFHKFDEIVACGYEAAKAKIKEWKTSGKIKECKKQVRRFSI